MMDIPNIAINNISEFVQLLEKVDIQKAKAND